MAQFVLGLVSRWRVSDASELEPDPTLPTIYPERLGIQGDLDAQGPEDIVASVVVLHSISGIIIKPY